MVRILNAGAGADTYGTDWIDAYPQRSEIKKVDMNKDRFPYKDNTFDEVYSKQVFAHLRNHEHFLKESYRVLKKGGKIVLTTDNAGFFGLVRGTHHGDYDKIVSKGKLDKCYGLFTTQHIRNWLEWAGFKNIRAEYAFLPIKKKSILLKLQRGLFRIVSIFSDKIKPNIMATGVK